MTQAAQKATTRKSRWGLYLPFLLFFIAAALYTVYWFTLAGEMRERVERFSQENNSEIVTGWGDFSVTGFPYRIGADFTAPTASAPNAPEAWHWKGERARVSLLAYNLRHAILVLDGEQKITYRDLSTTRPATNEISVTGEQMWGSYVVEKDQPFGRLSADLQNIEIVHRHGADDETEKLSAERAQLHTRPAFDEAGTLLPRNHDLALRVETAEVAGKDIMPVLGPQLDLFLIQARLRNLPDTEHASLVELLKEWQKTGGTVSLSDLIVKWGPLDLAAKGDLRLDARNRLEGQLDAKVTDFETLLARLVEAKVVKEDDARMALAGLMLVSQFQGNRSNEVRMPVIMREGRLYLGPLPIAELEPLY